MLFIFLQFYFHMCCIWTYCLWPFWLLFDLINGLAFWLCILIPDEFLAFCYFLFLSAFPALSSTFTTIAVVASFLFPQHIGFSPRLADWGSVQIFFSQIWDLFSDQQQFTWICTHLLNLVPVEGHFEAHPLQPFPLLTAAAICTSTLSWSLQTSLPQLAVIVNLAARRLFSNCAHHSLWAFWKRKSAIWWRILKRCWGLISRPPPPHPLPEIIGSQLPRSFLFQAAAAAVGRSSHAIQWQAAEPLSSIAIESEVAHNIELQARHTQRPELAAGKDLPPKRDAAVAACTILVRGSTWVRTENIHLILFFETWNLCFVLMCIFNSVWTAA